MSEVWGKGDTEWGVWGVQAVSPPPPVDEQSHSVVPVEAWLISEPCAEMGALWGSLGWRRGGWSWGVGGQQRTYLVKVEILGMGLLIEVCNKPRYKVQAGSSRRKRAHWCVFIQTCLDLPLPMNNLKIPPVWSILLYLESVIKCIHEDAIPCASFPCCVSLDITSCEFLPAISPVSTLP